MVKFLPIVALVGILIGVLIYFRLHSNSDLKSNQDLISQLASTSDQTTSAVNATDTNDRLKTLELAVGALIQKTNRMDNGLSATNAQIQSGSDLDGRIKKLETEVADLESRVGVVNPTAAVTTTSTTAGQKYPLYIPLATTGTSGDRNILPLPGSAASIDPASYPGYANVQLQVNMNLGEAAGTANAYLYNATDKTVVSGSQVSTTSSVSSLLTSATFKLPSGNKTYNLAIQSTQGYTVYVQSAQLKVNFQ